MITDDLLSFMKPKMSIEYRVEKNFLHSGDFNSIPKNACGARIVTTFPTVGANAEFTLSTQAFNLFVGEEFSIDDILKNANTPTDDSQTVIVAGQNIIDRIKEYEKHGYRKVVKTNLGIYPVSYRDAVFSNNEDMAAAITAIQVNFNSLSFDIQIHQKDDSKTI